MTRFFGKATVTLILIWAAESVMAQPLPESKESKPRPADGKPAPGNSGVESVRQAMAESRWEAALEALVPLISANWKNAPNWKLAAQLLGRAKLAGHPDLAGAFRDALLPVAGDNVEKRLRVLDTLVRSGQAQTAVGDYEALLKADPINAAAYVGLSEAYLEMGELDKAVGNADTAIRVSGNYVPGYVVKAKVQLQRREPEGAAETLRAALQKGRESAKGRGNDDAHGVMAQALLLNLKGAPQQEPAAAEIRRALQLDPENTESIFALGILQEQKGDQREAQKTWSRYLDIEPASRRAWIIANGLVVVRQSLVSPKSAVVAGWTPDGKSVLLSVSIDLEPDEGDASKLVLLAADGSGNERPVKTPGPSARFGGASFSPDGTKLVCAIYGFRRGGVRRCYWQPVEDPSKAEYVVTDTYDGIPFFNPCWSPDGKRILYNDVADLDHAARIVSVDATGRLVEGTARLPASLGQHRWARWTEEPGRLVYSIETPTDSQVLLSAADEANPSLLWHSEGNDTTVGFPDMSPDMNRVVFGLSRGRDVPGTAKTRVGFGVYVAPTSKSATPVPVGPAMSPWFCRAFWSPGGDRIVCDGPEWKPLVVTFGGLDMHPVRLTTKPQAGGLLVSATNHSTDPQQFDTTYRLFDPNSVLVGEGPVRKPKTILRPKEVIEFPLPLTAAKQPGTYTVKLTAATEKGERVVELVDYEVK